MNFDDTMQPPGVLGSGRFFRAGYLPTYAAAVFLLVLLWAGAPGQPIAFSRAWRAARDISVIDVLLLALVVTLVAVLLQPLQLGIVRALEGDYPRWLGSGLARAVQVWRKKRLAKRIEEAVLKAAREPYEPQRNRWVQQAGALSARMRSRYPMPDHLVRATALGNVLAAMEHTAGEAYGLDAVLTWPRLYPLLGEQVRAIVDDLRDSLDAAARLTATGLVTAIVATAVLAWHSASRTLFALAPLAIAWLAYVGAVRAALAYGEAVRVAFDLHRFDLISALHLPMPKDQSAEIVSNLALSDFLRQGVPLQVSYEWPDVAGG